MEKGLQCYRNKYLFDKIGTSDIIGWGSVLARKSIHKDGKSLKMIRSTASGCHNNKTEQFIMTKGVQLM